jgi:hypothetical protein
MHALPAEIGLSGIPGISGRERGVRRKRDPLAIGPAAAARGIPFAMSNRINDE